MKFSVTALLAAAASAQAWNVSYTTEVVTALTTYCPYATTIPVNGVTYTVTEATTLTITNCPCTLTKPVTTYSAPPPPSNSTVVVAKPTTTAAAVVTKSALPTAGAEKAVALSGAGLAGVLALAAFAL